MKLLIPTSKVGLLIGPKFKTINAIQNREGSLQQIGGGEPDINPYAFAWSLH